MVDVWVHHKNVPVTHVWEMEWMGLIGIDVGTTHIKAGLFLLRGDCVRLAMRPTPVHRRATGRAYYDPEEVFAIVVSLLDELLHGLDEGKNVQAIGIASMAETGVMIGAKDGTLYSDLMPWFDSHAAKEAEWIANRFDCAERFLRTGLRPSSKHGVAKVLWWKKQSGGFSSDARWLSMADYITYRFTGKIGTDYTLAARTYAFHLAKHCWDDEFIKDIGLSPDLFPNAHRSGEPVGIVMSTLAARYGFTDRVHVCVSGHDHLCAAAGVGISHSGSVFDSMGTAETLMGLLPDRPLSKEDYLSGLTFGRHVFSNTLYWMGSLPYSGGSLEWFRSILGQAEPVTYEQWEKLVREVGDAPTGLMYFPFLTGRGTPYADPLLRGSFIGLNASHKRGHMAKAVMEGTAFEIEAIRRRALQVLHQELSSLTVAGGGTRSTLWLQIKANVHGVPLSIPSIKEATLRGAAMMAALGIGIYKDANDAVAQFNHDDQIEIIPQAHLVNQYLQVFEQAYMPYLDLFTRMR